MGSKGRPWCALSRLLVGLQASRATVRYDIVSLRCLKAREEDRQTDRGADRKVLYRCEQQKNRQLQTAFLPNETGQTKRQTKPEMNYNASMRTFTDTARDA